MWMKSKNVSIQMKAMGQNFPVLPFTTMNKVVIPFEYVDKVLNFDHPNERC